MNLPNRILIATDLSEASLEAVSTGAALAKALSADVLLVTVLDPVPYVAAVDLEGGNDVWAQFIDDAETSLKERLQKVRDDLLAEGTCDVAVIRETGAANAIADFAKERGADLIVVGSHGRTGFKRLLLGSVAEKIVRLAHCPVFVVR